MPYREDRRSERVGFAASPSRELLYYHVYYAPPNVITKEAGHVTGSPGTVIQDQGSLLCLDHREP